MQMKHFQSIIVCLIGITFLSCQPNKIFRQSEQSKNLNNIPALRVLDVEGSELYHALSTSDLDSPSRHLPASMVIPSNPYISKDPVFIEAIARSSLMGMTDKLNSLSRSFTDGIDSALYAQYEEDDTLGFYGLELTSEAEAQVRELVFRSTWAKNVSLGRAAVYRKNLTVLVIWQHGVSPMCWKAVNQRISELLKL